MFLLLFWTLDQIRHAAITKSWKNDLKSIIWPCYTQKKKCNTYFWKFNKKASKISIKSHNNNYCHPISAYHTLKHFPVYYPKTQWDLRFYIASNNTFASATTPVNSLEKLARNCFLYSCACVWCDLTWVWVTVLLLPRLY